ncbi:MAG: YceI family protein [Opitutaceae bacterium]
MKTFMLTLRTLRVMAAIALAQTAPAGLLGAPATWDSAEFHAVVSGTSTRHDWSVETTTASGRYHATTGTGTITIPARSLSGGPKGLNERMHAALKADAFPTIVFEAYDFTPPAGAPDPGHTSSATIKGRLTIAGASRELALAVNVTATAQRIVLETDVPLKLTDFGIKPRHSWA